jgi:hypothetical protein
MRLIIVAAPMMVAPLRTPAAAGSLPSTDLVLENVRLGRYWLTVEAYSVNLAGAGSRRLGL